MKKIWFPEKYFGPKDFWVRKKFGIKEMLSFKSPQKCFIQKYCFFLVRGHDLYNLTAKLVVCFGPKLGL